MMRGASVLAVGLVAVLAGCSEIHGTWERIRVMPPDMGDQLPYTEMTFRKDGSFDGVETVDGANYPIAGRYDWWGDELDLILDGVTTNYPAHKTIDGKLVINHMENLSDITIVLKKVGPKE
jgi:hypothetical protein